MAVSAAQAQKASGAFALIELTRAEAGAYSDWIIEVSGRGGFDDEDLVGRIRAAHGQASQETGTNCGDDWGVGVNNFGEIVAGDTLFVPDRESTLQALNIEDVAAFPASHYRCWSFHEIGDRGWLIGQAVRDDAHETPVVLLLVPFDLNGNGIPDYREILLSENDLDEDDDWVIDWAQQFRSGVYGTGHPNGSYVDEMLNVQVVRLGMHQFQMRLALFNEPNTQSFRETINGYGYARHPIQGHQREVALVLRSRMPQEWSIPENRPPGYGTYASELDYIPPVRARAYEMTQDEILENYRCAGYWLARNIDYVQIGNEVFRGNGQYFIHPDDVGAPWKDGKFLHEVEPEYVDAACAAVFDWLEAQAAAFREGSAMAGRPLRLIGPGLTAGLLFRAAQAGHSGGNMSAFMVSRALARTNRYADFAAVHLHHATEHEVSEEITSAVRFLKDPDNWLVREGFAPAEVCCTEWGPSASIEWRLALEDQAKRYYQDWEGTPPDNENFLDYLDTDWLGHAHGPGRDMSVPAMFTLFSHANFRFACYGPTLQDGSSEFPNAFDFAAIMCSKINERYLPVGGGGLNWLIHGLYQESAAEHFNGVGYDAIHPTPLGPVQCGP